MLVELDHRDIVNLVSGMEPSYDLFEHPLIKPFGKYWDQGGWNWDKHQLIREEDEVLMMMYQLCKHTK